MIRNPNFSVRPRRMMVYCHDSMGVGHLRRSTAICEPLAAKFPNASFLIATGSPYGGLFRLPAGVDYVKLPALNKRSNGDYESKSMPLRTKQLLRCRRALLLATVNYFRPSILLVDKTPVGIFREMVPVLKWIQRNCPETTVVFGMRDIEDAPETTIREWAAKGVREALEDCYDEVWVYGSESVFDVVREYRLSDEVSRKLRYTGYLQRRSCGHGATRRGGERHVVVTVGGGSDGEDLLGKYIEQTALDVAKRGGRSTIVGGPDVGAGAANRLRDRATSLPRTTWLDHTHCMSCVMRSADLAVSMGGYNTLCEIASWRVPALVVPRNRPRMEQVMRAELWDRLGVISAVCPDSTTPASLSARVLHLLDHPRTPDTSSLDLGGLDFITDRCAAMWNGGVSLEAAVSV